MSITRFLTAAALAAAFVAAPAQAAVVELNFRDQPGISGALSTFGANVYLDWQNSFHAASIGSDYDFKFTYDTDLAGPNYGLSLVSGRVGGYTDFTGWNASLVFNPNSRLLVQLTRIVSLTSSIHYTGVVSFDMRDNDGDLGPTLPQALTVSNLDTATAAFEIRGTGGNFGQRYRHIGVARFDGDVGLVPRGGGDPPVGGVPEPGTWALMILGFGGAGAVLRRRRFALR